MFRFENDYEKFLINVKKCVDVCNEKKYDPPPINADDPHAIRYEVKYFFFNSVFL